MNRVSIASVPHLVHGRTTKQREPLTLFWTASGLELNVRASELWVEIYADWTLHEPWYSIMINGTFISRRMADKGTHRVCIFRGTDPNAVKNVRIIKDTQAYSADDNSVLQLCALETDGSFEAVEERKLKLEFIGDSITSGEGDIGEAAFEWDWTSMIFSAENNYAVQVGLTMNADVRVLSQSGWGVGCAWNNNVREAIPPIYEEVCGLLSGERNAELGAHAMNDFAAWQPDVIFINLGTNDCGSFNQPEWCDERTGERFKNRRNPDGTMAEADVERFIGTAKAFLYKLRRCNPKAKLVWIYGMLGNELEPALRAAVGQYSTETGDRNIDFLAMQDDTEHRGARNHPGAEAHRTAAKEILNYLNL